MNAKKLFDIITHLIGGSIMTMGSKLKKITVQVKTKDGELQEISTVEKEGNTITIELL